MSMRPWPTRSSSPETGPGRPQASNGDSHPGDGPTRTSGRSRRSGRTRRSPGASVLDEGHSYFVTTMSRPRDRPRNRHTPFNLYRRNPPRIRPRSGDRRRFPSIGRGECPGSAGGVGPPGPEPSGTANHGRPPRAVRTSRPRGPRDGRGRCSGRGRGWWSAARRPRTCASHSQTAPRTAWARRDITTIWPSRALERFTGEIEDQADRARGGGEHGRDHVIDFAGDAVVDESAIDEPDESSRLPRRRAPAWGRRTSAEDLGPGGAEGSGPGCDGDAEDPGRPSRARGRGVWMAWASAGAWARARAVSALSSAKRNRGSRLETRKTSRTSGSTSQKIGLAPLRTTFPRKPPRAAEPARSPR